MPDCYFDMLYGEKKNTEGKLPCNKFDYLLLPFDT